MQTFPSMFVRTFPLALALYACAPELADEDAPVPRLASHEQPAGPTPGSVRVDPFGTTCVSGVWTVQGSEAGGFRTFTVSTASSYTSLLAPESDRALFDCAVLLRLGVAPGESWALAGIQLEGTAELAAGAMGTVTLRMVNNGAEGVTRPFLSSEVRTAGIELRGPYTDTFALATEVPAAAFAWSGCGREHDDGMYLVTELKQGYPRARGAFTLAADGRTTFTFRYAVRKCVDGAGPTP